jgi:hypothetical protein
LIVDSLSIVDFRLLIQWRLSWSSGRAPQSPNQQSKITNESTINDREIFNPVAYTL